MTYPTDSDRGAKNLVDVVQKFARTVKALQVTVNAMPNAIKTEILGGAGQDVDTLKELADLISGNADDIRAIADLAGSHVRYDTAQTLTDAQKAQARDNIGAVSALGETDWDSITNKPTFATVATSGSYSDLTDRPTIPTVPSNVSAFTNDAGYLTGIAWGDVTNKPETFTASAHTHTKSEITDFPTLATVATSGSYNDLSHKPTIPDYSGEISSLQQAVAGNVKYTVSQSLNDTQKAQARSNIGAGTSSFDGNYNSLSNKPTIPTVPTALSSFTDDLGSSPTHTHSQYLTEGDVVPVSSLATVATSGSYNDLTDRPTIVDYSTDISNLQLAVSGNVKYTVAQTLTDAQKKQARSNIGVNGVYYGVCDGTATAQTVTISGINDYYDGLVVFLRINVATQRRATLNINNIGAKPMRFINDASNATSTGTTYAPAGCVVAMAYDSAQDLFRATYDYDSTNVYQLRHNYGNYKVATVLYRYQLLFQTSPDTLIPANATSNSTGTSKTLMAEEFDPFGAIVYYSTTTTVAAGSNVGASSLYEQYSLDLRYAFNAGSTLTSHKAVYLKCSPQSNGRVKFASGQTIVQALPTTDDGFVYILLGQAYSAYQIELYPVHPVYQFKSGRICLYTGADFGDIDCGTLGS